MQSIKHANQKNKPISTVTTTPLCPDFFPGDVLLKRAGDNLPHKIIAKSQQLPGNTSRDPDFVHAAIVRRYCPYDEVPSIYEVTTKGLLRETMSDETWVCYRWPTDFDESFAQVLHAGEGKEFLVKIEPLLSPLSNPLAKLTHEQVSLLEAQIQALELPAAFDKELLNDAYMLRRFVKACGIFQLRERVVSWAKALHTSESKIHYNKLGAMKSVVASRLRQDHMTENQITRLRQYMTHFSSVSGTNFCSEFVVMAWTLPLLERLPADISVDELHHFLPINVNLNAASPAHLETYFQKKRRWQMVINPVETYRIALLKRIIQTATVQADNQPHYGHKINPLMQCKGWHEIVNELTSLLLQATSWAKGSIERLILEALQRWNTLPQKLTFPFTESQSWLLEKMLQNLPLTEKALCQRVFSKDAEGTLVACHAYQDLLNDAEKSRAEPIYTTEVLQKGYVIPLFYFLEWTTKIAETRPAVVLSGANRLLQVATDYVNLLVQTLSARTLTQDEASSLLFIESAILTPLSSSWRDFWDLLSPHNLVIQIDHWGRNFLTAFLAYRRKEYDTTITHPLMSILEDYPDETGWTVKAQQKALRWQEKIKTLQAPEQCQTDYLIETVEQGEIQRFFLKQDIGQALLGNAALGSLNAALSKGRLKDKKRYANERHIFYRQGDILLKLQRQDGDTLLGNELVVHHLHDALGLDVLPASSLWRLHVKNKIYYCWISEFMEGELLGHVMKQNPDKLTTLSPQSLSQLYFLTLATCQEDANPFNISVTLDAPYHLRTFDVGHAFVLPTLESRVFSSVHLELKSMVFLLPQMSEPLDLGTREKLMLLDLPIWLKAQRESIKGLAQDWKKLLLNEKHSNPDLIQLPITAWHWVEFVLTGMQTKLRDMPLMSHAELFAKLLPTVASYYHEKRLTLIDADAYRHFNFAELNQKAYKEIIVRSPEGEIQTLTSSRRHQEIRKIQQRGSNKYLQLFSPGMQHKNAGQAFILLQALSARNIKEIDLNHNVLVQDNHIMAILRYSPQLEKLNVKYCPQLTGRGWLNKQLFQTHPNLKLNISGTVLEDDNLWKYPLTAGHVLSWTKPRKVFLDQFEQWKKNGWKALEKQLFTVPLTEPEEVYLTENLSNYKDALQNLPNLPPVVANPIVPLMLNLSGEKRPYNVEKISQPITKTVEKNTIQDIPPVEVKESITK
ncbi:MAG: hypothetical protein K2Q14_00175, partial [Gammaproteobacteria bacterium]|nr:hypothetical protein [Gammaproteobacteria bacterium]